MSFPLKHTGLGNVTSIHPAPRSARLETEHFPTAVCTSHAYITAVTQSPAEGQLSSESSSRTVSFLSPSRPEISYLCFFFYIITSAGVSGIISRSYSLGTPLVKYTTLGPCFLNAPGWGSSIQSPQYSESAVISFKQDDCRHRLHNLLGSFLSWFYLSKHKSILTLTWTL